MIDEQPITRQGTILLLVEDNPDDEKQFMLAFQSSRILNQVLVARDGAEALDMMFTPCRKTGGNLWDMVQAVFLDLKLPKIDGLEVLRRLRDDDRTKNLPIVVFTSSNEQEDIVKSYGLGADGYIRKPVESNQFLEAVRHAGLFSILVKEPSLEHHGSTR
jgi:two-component system response regulator